jgi:triacylglycerol esterase/lipase EstA (alpha/beta hydrolase family)
MTMLSRLFCVAAAAAVSLSATAVLGPTAAAEPTVPGPSVPGTSATEPVPGYDLMGTPPEGSNDWDCKPTAAHPRPIVLVHGTGSSMQQVFPVLSPALKEEGYCVFALNYGGIPTWYNPKQIIWGVADIKRSAYELSTFVDAVLARTGAGQVDLVGHSQGGVVARQYLKFGGGADTSDPARNKVGSLVALGPTNHGTTFNGQQQLYNVLAQSGLSADVINWVIFGLAGRQQLVGSRLINDLNATSETMPGINYTIIAAKDDDVVTPPESSFLASDGGNVRNIWVQDGCPGPVGHSGLMLLPRPIYLIQTALDPGFADKHSAPCP